MLKIKYITGSWYLHYVNYLFLIPDTSCFTGFVFDDNNLFYDLHNKFFYVYDFRNVSHTHKYLMKLSI